MSDAIFPSLAGLSWNSTKAPRFNTKIQTSVNLTEVRATFASAPLYDFTLSYDLLRDTTGQQELRSLAGFFMARYGSWDSFRYQDPDDSTVVAQAFGTGDGVTTEFPLVRSFGTWVEATKNIATAAIYKDAVLQSANYTLAANGTVTFTPAPASNVSLTWSGTYYFRCRFGQDVQDFRQFMRQLWDARTVQFVGSLGLKI